MRVAFATLLCSIAIGLGCSSSDSTPSSTPDSSTDGAVVDSAPIDTGTDSGCGDTDSDPKNCGECGKVCESGLYCVAGKCSVACPASQKDCSGSCVTLETDRANCGVCGTACAAGEVCSAGKCALSCGAGLKECGDAAGRTCANTASDRDNCGECGKACVAGEICAGGACVASCGTGLTECTGTCRDTSVDPKNCGTCGKACADGEVCSAGTCAATCGAGLANCGGVCRNLKSDNKNCGVCTSACAAGEVCSDGTCGVSCGGGLKDCGSTCRDTRYDRDNCGGCGISCTVGQVCNAGVCETSCGTLKNCSGTCKDTKVDAANCGDCGTACAAGQVCSGGTCTTTCGSFTSCSGTCKDTTSDSFNCGTCGKVCADGEKCSGSACVLSCPTGLAKCGTACVNKAVDGTNCGTCGHACATGETCSGGTCITAMSGGGCGALTDCGGGVCKDTQIDSKNCGTCGNACTGSKTCQTGSCACPAGRVSCGGICADPAGNSTNCGGCGKVCTTGQVCAGGTCTATVAGDGGSSGSLTGSTPPKVAVLSATSNKDLQTKLQATSAFGTVDFYNINSVTPTLDQLKAYDAVVVYTYLSITSGATFSENLSQYLEAGGGVVLFDYETQETGTYGLTGRYQTTYALSTPISSSDWIDDGTITLGTINDVGSSIFTGVTTAGCDSSDCSHLPTSAFKPAAHVVASWSDGTPAVVTATINGHRVAEINLHGRSKDADSTDGWNPASDTATLIANTLKWTVPLKTIQIAKTFDVGTAPVATSVSKTFVINNGSTTAQTITGASFSGTHIGDFGTTATFPQTIPAGGTLSITVTCRPSDTGLRAATMQLALSGASPAGSLLTCTGN